MVFFYHGQTGRNGSVQNDQPNQPTVHGLHCSFTTTGEPTVRLVNSVRFNRLKEQALRLEKGLDLALVRSRSRLGREYERLGLVKMWEGLGLGLKIKRLGLAPQGLVYITGFSDSLIGVMRSDT